MGKGGTGAELKIKIKLETFGGLGRIFADVKVEENKKVVLEYEAPMMPLIKEFPWENRHEAEEKFKEIASFLERWVRDRVFTD